MSRLEGKVAIITGAASGIGRASARLFAVEGASLVLADVDVAGGERLAAELAASGTRAVFVRTDVSRGADVEAMVERTMSEYGRLDVVFNNAGIEGESNKIEYYSEDGWDRVIGINLKGVWLGMKYAIPAMKAEGGSIINTASVAGLVGWKGASAYSAAKGGVVVMTKTAALEYAPRRIRVNCICPGFIHTAMTDRLRPDATVDEADARLAQAQPLPLAGQPEDIAKMALYLASDESRFVTGQAMVVDGGFTTR